MVHDLQFQWCDSIDAIARPDWNRYFRPTSFARSHAYQVAVEASAPPGVSFHYLLVRQAGELQAIIGCASHRRPLLTPFGSHAHRVVRSIRRWSQQSLQVPVFCVGHRTAMRGHLFGFGTIGSSQRHALLRASHVPIRARARQLGCWLTVIRTIPAAELDIYAPALGDRYVFLESAADAVWHIEATRANDAQIRDVHQLSHRGRRSAERGLDLSWQVDDGPIDAALAAELERLFASTQAGRRGERISADTFQALCNGRSPSFVVLCFAGPRLVGFSLNVEEADRVCAWYIGIDDPGGRLQLAGSLLDQIIANARQRGRARVQLGPNSNCIADAHGGELEPQFLAVQVHNRLLHAFLHRLGAHREPWANERWRALTRR